MFHPERTLEVMESLRKSNGAFIASPTSDYSCTWIRDQLFMAVSYWYLGREHEDKLVAGIQAVFNIFHKQRHKLERIIHPRNQDGKLIIPELLHAKYDPETFNEVTIEWGHHQLDTIGLFLHMVADLAHKHKRISRDRGDEEILQLLVFYLQNVQYWKEPDYGMWEDCLVRKSSSLGAVVGGLTYIQRKGLAIVPDELIGLGRNELRRILPYESRDACTKSHHNHDCDAAQLFLIWPFNVIELEMADLILSRIIDGHKAADGSLHRLVQPLGINRYWGDDYYRSEKSGISAQWQWDFLISIIYSQRQEYEKAVYWFRRGASRITPAGFISEAYVDDTPNNHTPLGWMHALALVAYSKLPQEFKIQVIGS